jgi:hypothetical protein
VLKLYFPAVAERYRKCIEYHQRVHNISTPFGLFFNFCINGIFPGQLRVHTKPHADYKNILGICLLLVYLIPGELGVVLGWVGLTSFAGGRFDHRTKSWLVIWEAGVVLELPPWVVLLYPSSLFYHFNIDISGAC